MHEATIAQSLLNIVQRAVADTDATEILRIDVSIGRLKAVEPELVASCFRFLAEGTICERAQVVIDEVPIRVQCRDCGETSRIAGYKLRCAACCSKALRFIGGSELRVERIQAH